jgi:hypothetical protein
VLSHVAGAETRNGTCTPKRCITHCLLEFLKRCQYMAGMCLLGPARPNPSAVQSYSGIRTPILCSDEQNLTPSSYV